MTDDDKALVKRLRKQQNYWIDLFKPVKIPEPLCDEAADRIEAQAAEIERLKCEVKKQRSLRDQASFNAGLEQAAVIAKEWGDDAALTIDDVDGLSAISLAAVKGNVAAAFAISTAIRAALGETE